MIIIITGSRKGIGKYLSERFLSEGHTVIGCSRRPASLGDSNYRHFELDICDEKDVTSMMRHVAKEFGQVDALVNNAGIASMNHALTTTRDKAQQIIDTNFIGTFICTREVGKLMSRKKYGRIVNFTTVAAGLRLEGEAVYAASKAAVANYTQTVAKELAPYNITVNAIGPTPVETDLIKAVPAEKIEELIKKQAIHRLGNFEDVHNVVDFFLRPKSSFITGQVVYLGGVHD